MTDQVPERDVLLVPVRTEEDVALARHEVLAAHARRGLAVVVDLGELEPVAASEAAALVEELARATLGNGQSLHVVGSGLPLDGAGLGHVQRHVGFAEALEAAVPLGGKTHAVHLTLPARVEPLAAVRHHLAAIVRRQHGEADGFQAELLLDEMCLNAVENSTSSRNSYEVSFRLQGHELAIDVTNVFDDAVDPARIMHRRLASFDDSGRYLGERGRGLFLIARLADGLQIRPLDADRIKVSVTKRLRGTGPDPG